MSLLRRKDKSELPVAENGAVQENQFLKPNLSFQSTRRFGEAVPITHIYKSIKWKFIMILLLIWLIMINSFERSAVRRAMVRCEWSKWENWQNGNKPHRIALIADPQLIDDYSYPGRPAIVNYYIKKISDNYLHRNHRYMQELIDPDTTIFLGDLFDGGRDWEDDQWFEEYERFGKIYPKKPNRRTINSLPGNHDIGFETMSLKVNRRFASFFGEPNDIFEFGNHSIIQLDTISLSSEDPAIKKDALEFLRTINQKLNPDYPRILLTHVPLWRFKDKQLCGPLRESAKLFPIQKGYQYQTAINQEITQEILQSINPSIIFGGDDHDYCHIDHSFIYNGANTMAEEITVKAVTMTGGIKRPAFQLLSLNNPNITPLEKKNSYKTTMCYLPAPYKALNAYILTLVLTLGSIVLAFGFPDKAVFIERFINTRVSSLDTKKTDLPVYENGWKKKEVNFDLRERDLIAVCTNSTVLIIGVYLMFGFYYTHV